MPPSAPITNDPSAVGVENRRKRARGAEDDAEDDAEDAAEDDAEDDDAVDSDAEDEDAEDADGMEHVPAIRLEPINWTESDPFIWGIVAVSNRNRVRDGWGRIRDASITARGYRTVTIAGRRWFHHRLVYLAWYGRAPRGQIDHRNSERADNTPGNLEDVTPSENMRRSHANPNRRTCAEQRSKPIVGTLGGTEPREFPSATVAARELCLTQGNITACCRGKMTSTRGWMFAYKDQPDLEGEEWRPIQEIQVSNCGRAQTPWSGRYFPKPRVDGYCSVNSGGQAFQFHRLVCQAFHGPPPAGYQADHIDSNPSNNRADNLQWLPPTENVAKRQRAPQMSTRQAIATSTGGCYDSLTHASEATGIHKSRIQKLCTTGKPHSQHGIFAYVAVEPIDGEIFKNITTADLLALGREQPSGIHVMMK